MSVPDYISVTSGPVVIPRYADHPRAVAILPIGVGIDDVGGPGQRIAGIFLVDPDCAGQALNDTALDAYLRARTPILIFAARARDLRPFLRRAEAFRARGMTIETML